MKKIFIVIGCILIAFSSGCITGYILGLPDNDNTGNPVKTLQISGETIKHTPIKVNKNTIEFNTIADGQGEINTEIEKIVVPEARMWIEKVHCVQVSVDTKKELHVSYLRRFGVFAIGGGISATLSEELQPALFVTGQYWF